MADSAVNGGTVRNIFNALEYAIGKYIKLISPGDMFYDEHALEQWVGYMEEQDSKVCFCNSVYYMRNEKNENGIEIVRRKSSPANADLYRDSDNYKALFVDYLLGNDSILGASLMMRKETMTCYIEQIVGKIRFAEDYMVRIMVFEGVKIDYFQEPLIWYEYGYGISTNKAKVWNERLFRGFQACNQIIFESSSARNSISNRYKCFLKMNIKNDFFRKAVKCVMFPSVIYWRNKARKSEYYSFTNVEPQLLIDLHVSKYKGGFVWSVVKFKLAKFRINRTFIGD